MEKTLIIIKPDALQRNLIGEIITRFERKGLKILGLKMLALDNAILNEHYIHHKGKPFFPKLKNFMKSTPVVVMAIGGLEAINAVRLIVGITKSRQADAGTIRGDLAMSGQCNLIHASDSPENAEKEIYRFFNEDELFDYKKLDTNIIYGEDEVKHL